MMNYYVTINNNIFIKDNNDNILYTGSLPNLKKYGLNIDCHYFNDSIKDFTNYHKFILDFDNNDYDPINIIGADSFITLTSDKKMLYCGVNGNYNFGKIDNEYEDSFEPSYFNFWNKNTEDYDRIIQCNDSVYIITKDGLIYACGNNSNGELGVGYNNSFITYFTLIKNIKNVKDIYFLNNGQSKIITTTDNKLYFCGRYQINNNINYNNYFELISENLNLKKVYTYQSEEFFYITEDNKLYASGTSSIGILGNNNSKIPELKNIDNVLDIFISSLGNYYILNTNNQIYACGQSGANSYGQLGLGDTENHFTPTLIPNLTNIKEIIENTYYSTYFLTNDGLVYSCGENNYGQLGLGDNIDRNTPELIKNIPSVSNIYINSYTIYLLTTDNSIYSFGNNENYLTGFNIIDNINKPTLLKEIKNNVKEVIIGYNTTFFLTLDNNLYSCGTTYNGITENKNSLNKVSQESLFKNVDKILYTGQLVWLYKNNKLYYFGNDTVNTKSLKSSVPILLKNLNIKSIYGNKNGYFIFTNDGNYYTLGTNNYNSLFYGNSTTNTSIGSNLVFHPKNIKNITNNSFSTYLLTNDGLVYSCGHNQLGQLGLGDNIDYYTYFLIPNLTNVKEVVSIANSVYFLTNDGLVYSCGENTYGQLGLGDNNNDYYSPTLIPNLTNVKEVISNNGASIYFLTNDDTVYSCGANDDGQLGLGDNIDRNIPTLIPNLINIKDIISNNSSTYLLTNDGLVYSCGYNGHGQLGLGDSTNNHYTPILIPNLTNIKDIIYNSYSTYLLTNDGLVYSCGRNDYGQLGLGDNSNTHLIPILIPNLTNIKEVISNSYSTYFLTNDNTVYSCGLNNFGQLGLGDSTNNHYTPTLIPNLTNIKEIISNFSTYLLTNDGLVYSCGYNGYGQLGLGDSTNNHYTPTLIPNLTNVKEIINSNYSTYLLTNDGLVYSCGRNDYGQLGLGDNSNTHLIPILIPNLTNIKEIKNGYSSYFLTEDGLIYSCGHNQYGQLGLGNTTNELLRSSFYYPLDEINIKDIIFSENFSSSYLLTNDGLVYSCGYNADGQLGLGDTNNRNIPTLIPNLTNVKEIKSNDSSNYFLTEDGTVYSCGRNQLGQLGLGDTTNRTTPTLIPNLTNVKEIFISRYYEKAQIVSNCSVYLLTNDNLIYSFGLNSFGQLGLGDVANNHYTPTLIPNLNNVKKVKSNSTSSYLLTNDGLVYSCGWNRYGQLGLGDTNGRNIFTLIENIPIISNIFTGYCGDFVFLLTNDGLVYSCGINTSGQLGLGDNNNNHLIPTLIPNLTNVKEIFTNSVDYATRNFNYNSSYAVTNDNTIYSCGNNNYGQLGLGDYDISSYHYIFQTMLDIKNNIDKLFSNYSNSIESLKYFIKTKDNYIYSWGKNRYGELGIKLTNYSISNSSTYKYIPTLIENLENVKDVYSFDNITFFKIDNGKIYGCGYNGHGELGLGDTTNRLTPTLIPNITSDNLKILNSNFIYFIDNDNDLSAFGENNLGELSQCYNYYFNKSIYLTPTKIFKAKNIKKIQSVTHSINNYKCSTLFLMNNGEIYGCGCNKGTLYNIPTTSSNDFTIQTITNLKDFNDNFKINFTDSEEKIIDMQSCRTSTLFLTNKGNIIFSGSSSYFNNGYFYKIDAPSNIPKQIDYTNDSTIFFLTEDNKVYGRGPKNEIGLRNTTDYLSNFNEIKFFTNLNKTIKKIVKGYFLTEDGYVYYCTNGSFSNFFNLTNVKNIKKTEDRNYVLFIMNDNTVKVYGNFGNEFYSYPFTLEEEVKDIYYIPNTNLYLYILNSINNKFIIKNLNNNYGKNIDINNNLYTEILKNFQYSFQNDIERKNYLNTLNIKNINYSDSLCLQSNDNTFYINNVNNYYNFGNGTNSSASYNMLENIKSINGEEIKKIIFNKNYLFVLTKEKHVYVQGNYQVYLGLNINYSTYSNTSLEFTLLNTLKNIKDIKFQEFYNESNYLTIFAITDDDLLYAWGDNNYGQLGLGNTSLINQPEFIIDLKTIKKFYSSNSSFIINNDGLVYSCGLNNFGQLGLGNTVNRNVPTLIPNLTNVKNIICNDYSTYFLTEDGLVYSCGQNTYGQLGLGDNNSNHYTPTLIPNLTNIKEVISVPRSGIISTYFLTFDNKIYACGYNDFGQLGLGDNNSNHYTPTLIPNFDFSQTKQIKIASTFMLVLQNNGDLYFTGYYLYFDRVYQLTKIYSNIKVIYPIEENEYLDKYLLTKDDKYYTINENNEIIEIENITNLTEETFIENGFTKEKVNSLPAESADYKLLINTPNNYNSINYDINLNNSIIKTFNNSNVIMLNNSNKNYNLIAISVPKDAQLIVGKGDINLSNIKSITKFQINSAESNNSFIKIVVSNDSGSTWYTINKDTDTFESINELSLEEVSSKGISPTDFNDISSENWNNLLLTNKKVKFAYLLSLDKSDDVLFVDDLSIYYVAQAYWKSIIQDDDYNYYYASNDLLKIKLYSDGDYKINYYKSSTSDSNANGLSWSEFNF